MMENIESHIGELVMVEVIDEVMIGTLKHISPNQFIEIENAREITRDSQYSNTQLLALPHIKSIRLISKNETISNKYSIPSSTEPSTSAKPEVGLTYPSVRLSDMELQHVHKRFNSAVFVMQTDEKYHKAMADINNQQVIALLVDPEECHRNCRTSILAVATENCVYLFDIVSLGKIPRALRKALEAMRPRKVLHNSAYVVDHLLHRYNLELNAIFDTLQAYCGITGNENTLSFVQTAQRTFDMPASYFFVNNSESNKSISYQRPLPQSYISSIAKMAVFQLKLYEYLLHNYMLAKFYRKCSSFSKTFSQNKDPVEAAMIHSRFNNDSDHIQDIDAVIDSIQI